MLSMLAVANRCRLVGLSDAVFHQIRLTSNVSKGKYCCDFKAIENAMRTIKPYTHRTPIVTSTFFNDLSGRKMFFKAENLQKTGSFKIRGAANAVMKFQKKSVQPKCILTHSSGNHGQALAKAAQIIGVPCYVVMPETSSYCKVEAVKNYGAVVVFCPNTQSGRYEVSAKIIQEKSAVFVHPSQNADVIAGQGTLGIEILQQNQYIDAIVVPIGGGGMISGIAIAAKSIKPSIKIIGAEPELANDCYLSKQKGELTISDHYSDTIADGARVNIDTFTWPIIRDLVDDVITVSEEEIKNATLQVWERLKLVVEPTSGVAVAAAMSSKFAKVKGENICVVLCGGNFDLSSLMLLTN